MINAVLNSSAEAFLRWLLLSSASATLIAGVVVILQAIFGRWLTPAGRQRLWLLVIIRLLLPVLPASALSVWNLPVEKLLPTRHSAAPTVSIPAISTQFVTTIRIKPISTGSASTAATPVLAETRPPRSRIEWVPTIAFGVWAIVAIVIFARLIWVNRALRIRLRRASAITDEPTLQLVRDCATTAGLRKPPGMVVTDAVRTPAVHGVWNPRILLPTELLDSLTPTQRRHIILHELSHIRHHDLLANWLLALLSIIHWFNPLLWLASARLKSDRELARDAWVIQKDCASGDAEGYADTLIDLAQRISIGRTVTWPQVVTPLPGLFGRRTSLRRRLHMIARQSDAHRSSRVIGFALIAILGPLLLTRAKAQWKPGEVRNDISPSTRPLPTASTHPASDADDDAELRWTIKDLTSLAKSAIAAERYDDALSIIDKLRSRDPNNVFARNTRQQVLEKTSAGRRASMAMEMQRLLARKLPSVNFDGVGLNNVVDFLRDVSGADIYVNWKVMERVGIDRNTPIKIKVKDATFEKTLNLVLNSAGAGDVQLAYGIEDNVITISTRSDVQRNVVIRVYDIRDLLADPLILDSKSDTPNSRQGRIDALTKQILNAVDTNSWKDNGGNVGSLRVFDPSGQLIVTQTTENHRALIDFLDSMRAPRVSQILLEAEYLDCDSLDLEREIKTWWTPLSLKPPTPQEAASGVVLPPDLLDQRIAAFKKSGKASLLAAPRFMLIDGQEASVQTSSKRSYISDYVLVKPSEGVTRYEPVRQNVNAGIEIEASASVSDRNAIKLKVHPKVSALARMTSVPWPGRPEGSNLMVEVPELNVTAADIAALVPSGRTLVVTVAQQLRGRSLLILVKPTIVRANVDSTNETRQSNLFRYPNDFPGKPVTELKTNRKD